MGGCRPELPKLPARCSGLQAGRLCPHRPARMLGPYVLCSDGLLVDSLLQQSWSYLRHSLHELQRGDALLGGFCWDDVGIWLVGRTLPLSGRFCGTVGIGMPLTASRVRVVAEPGPEAARPGHFRWLRGWRRTIWARSARRPRLLRRALAWKPQLTTASPHP